MLALAKKLRDNNVDAMIDQYIDSPPEGWPTWMEDEIEASEFVLVICTETYLRRFRKKEEVGKGLGATWEGAIITQELYNSQGRNTKFIPVVFTADDAKHIPIVLQGVNHYNPTTEEGFDLLLRRLKGKHATPKPPLGPEPHLQPRERKQDFVVPQKFFIVPQQRTDWFTGREKLLATLHENFITKGIRKQAITGLGGKGKTQTAAEYAYRHRDDYRAILWVRASSEESINSGFGTIARMLELPGSDSSDQTVVRHAVTSWLSENDGWLLIFDNADWPELIKPLLPIEIKGAILLTSRPGILDALGNVTTHSLGDFEPDEALDFLLARTSRQSSQEKEQEAARDLAKELGYLPLALEQAAAYIVAKESTFQDYLKTYRNRGVALLNDRGPVAGGYSELVATTWKLNFGEVEKTPPAAELLRVSAFLAPDDIPFELVTGGAAQVGSALGAALADYQQNPLLLDEALAPLRKYSLISRSTGASAYSIHRIAQAVIRDRMTQEDRRNYAERAVRAVDAAFPMPEFQNWSRCERMLPQALACARWIENLGFEFVEAALLLNQTGFYLNGRGAYSQAEPLYRRALAIREKSLPPDHPHIALVCKNLAAVLQELGRTKEATALRKRAQAIQEQRGE